MSEPTGTRFRRGDPASSRGSRDGQLVVQHFTVIADPARPGSDGVLVEWPSIAGRGRAVVHRDCLNPGHEQA